MRRVAQAAAIAALGLAAAAAAQDQPGQPRPPLPPDPVFDSACEPAVDLRSAGGSMSHVELRDQAGEFECYAEAAAQLLDAWRFSVGGDTHYAHQTSGFALALQTNSDVLGTGLARPELPLPGQQGQAYAVGEACMAVGTALDQGSCDQRAVLQNLDGGDLTGTVTALRRYYDDYQTWRDGHDSLAEQVRVTVSGEDSKRTLVARSLARRLSALPSDMRPTAAELGPLLDAPQAITFLRGVMTRACERGHTQPVAPQPSCAREAFASAADAYAGVLRRLRARRAQPVAIAFCSEVLNEGRAYEDGAWGRLPAAARMADLPRCQNHQALVIGVRRDPKTRKCQFLVRNSLGPRCSGYSPDWLCDGGALWVDAQNLSYNTFGLAALH